MNRIVCSIVFGHRPRYYNRDPSFDGFVCRCGANAMPAEDVFAVFGDSVDPWYARRRNRRRREVALWGSLVRRQFGSWEDRQLALSDRLLAEYLREQARESIYRARLEFAASRPASLSVIKGVTA